MSKPSKTPKPESGSNVEAARGAEPKARQTGVAGPLSALNALRKVFRAVFVDQLRLRREGAYLTLGLASTEAPAVALEVPAVAAHSPAVRMQRALSELLDTRPDSRPVLKHLAALEHHLIAQEGPFIQDLSISSLEIMLRQLHGLIAPPPSRGVALLMTELLDAVEQKTRQEQVQAGSLHCDRGIGAVARSSADDAGGTRIGSSRACAAG